jgi:hypothetical protein
MCEPVYPILILHVVLIEFYLRSSLGEPFLVLFLVLT